MPRIPTQKEMIDAARAEYGKDGKVEIDDNAVISRAEGNPEHGAYVQAWVWVSDSNATGIPESEFEEEKGEGEEE